MAESFNEREHLKKQNEQDEAASLRYTPQSLLKNGNTAAGRDASLPFVAIAEKAVNLCNFDSALNKENCEKAFPLYEEVISGLPSTSEQIQKIQEERNIIERKWGQQPPISEDEKTQYWQKLDVMSSAVNMRFMYGVTLNNYGYQFNDEAAKAKGLEVLGQVSKLEPRTSEFIGALMQAKRSEAVNFRKADSEGSVQKAVADLPQASVKQASWANGMSRWAKSSLGLENSPQQERLVSLAKVANDLQRAVDEAPITTKEYIDKASKTLAPESVAILQNAFEEELN